MKSSIYLITLILFAFSATSTFAEPSRTINLLQPTASNGTAESQARQSSAEPYITRIGQVTLQTEELFAKTPASANRTTSPTSLNQTELILAFFPEKEFRILVDSESSPLHSLLSLGGREINSDIATFTMTVTEEDFLINYQDLDSGMSYTVKGKTATGLGEVTEIDLAKTPPTYDLPPVVE